MTLQQSHQALQSYNGLRKTDLFRFLLSNSSTYASDMQKNLIPSTLTSIPEPSNLPAVTTECAWCRNRDWKWLVCAEMFDWAYLVFGDAWCLEMLRVWRCFVCPHQHLVIDSRLRCVLCPLHHLVTFTLCLSLSFFMHTTHTSVTHCASAETSRIFFLETP